jgi:DNA polymerase III delta prime subunit
MSNIINQIAWFLKYAPKEIEEYVFNDKEQEKDVKEWIDNNSIPGNLLLYGPAGCGKTSLSELLIKKLIKKSANVKTIKSRSVSEIDNLYTWIQKRPSKPDTKKIVYIEEFDRLSIQAMNQLKDTLLEKFQEHAIFIVCTNHISKIPNPILSRFTYKYNFDSVNKEGTLKRVREILRAENVEYDLIQLKTFVDDKYTIGLRNIINVLQINTINNSINFNNINVNNKNNIENSIINLSQEIFKTTLGSNMSERKMIYQMPMSSKVCKEYNELIEIVSFNYNINWEEIYLELYNKNTFLPLIRVIEKYINSLETKKIQHIHFMSFISEGIEIMVDISV